MKTIWKYPLAQADVEEILMPVGAQVLTVQVQNHTPCLWALVDPAEAPEPRRFRIVGTGDELETTPGEYVGTFQQGAFVWHLFEEPGRILLRVRRDAAGAGGRADDGC